MLIAFIRFALFGAMLLLTLPLVGAALAGAVLVLILCAIVIKALLFSDRGTVEQPTTGVPDEQREGNRGS